jgi:hypothetical protein
MATVVGHGHVKPTVTTLSTNPYGNHVESILRRRIVECCNIYYLHRLLTANLVPQSGQGKMFALKLFPSLPMGLLHESLLECSIFEVTDEVLVSL